MASRAFGSLFHYYVGLYMSRTHPLPQSMGTSRAHPGRDPIQSRVWCIRFLRRLDSHLPCSCGTGNHIPSLYTSLKTHITQFYIALYPLGKMGKIGTAEDFFKQYLALPVVIVFWICGYFWKRTGWLRTSQIDVDTGRREVNWQLINATRAEIASYPAWKRLGYFLF